MKFNLAVNLVLATWSLVYVGRLVTTAPNDWASASLYLCLALAVLGAIWRGTKFRQEPAVFAAVTYLLFGAIAVVAEAIAGDPTRAVIGAMLSPLVAVFAVVEPQFRRWINRIARYPGGPARP
ncbi:hypothetical protein K3888_04325 [Dietzia aurantiaca]|uniref:hypothetical protein n=1 Tax=Dietzia aurantiaca TaxID=983873 RepID=UPI001E28365D|nr:hypothetical protein [Dietzia aurantiaca]MCD2261919.1 hypothetical protein [Dietzia aurantiaca]